MICEFGDDQGNSVEFSHDYHTKFAKTQFICVKKPTSVKRLK